MKHLFTIITIALALLIAWGIIGQAFVMGAGAYSTLEQRSNACRTYHLFAHQKQDDRAAETDGMLCGNGQVIVTVKQADKSVSVDTVSTVEPVAEVQADTSEPAVNDNPAFTSEKGNPGNLKSVGNSGENPNGKDTMPLDNTGGNGNGEHGNQGVNH